ncbi:MAG: hypothetical protein U9O83_01095 [Campylobacterota bacterium]|nr:hypothetical protein [Campylobacterota bacterium]
MVDLYEEHKKEFGFYPIKIGILGLNEEDVLNDISIAIDKKEPYNEYNTLSDKEKELYDKEMLIF